MPAMIDTTKLPKRVLCLSKLIRRNATINSHSKQALHVLGLASRTSNLLDIRKPDYVRNDFAVAIFSEDCKTVELELERFNTRTRMQPGASQVGPWALIYRYEFQTD